MLINEDSMDKTRRKFLNFCQNIKQAVQPVELHLSKTVSSAYLILKHCMAL